MKEIKEEPPLPRKGAIPKATATSTSTNESSVEVMQSATPDLSDDFSELVDSVFLRHKNQATKTKSTSGSTKSNSSATAVPDWQQWWNDIKNDVDVSCILNSGIKSILNGAYRIASQRVYDTAVRKKNSNSKASVVSTPTISNSQRRSNGIIHPERRSHVQSRDMSHDFPQHHDYYGRNHNHYNQSMAHPPGALRKENPRQNSNRDMRMDEMQPYLPSRGPNDYYSNGWSHSSRRESQHNRYHHDKRNYSDDDSYSYSSRGHHYHRHHDRKRHDLPYPKDDHISGYENDHRSLASSISTKPQIGIPITYDVTSNNRHHYSREEHIERERRHHQQHRRRSSSDSSTSDRTRHSDYSSRRRNRRRSHDDYERDRHSRYDDYDRRHHRHRHEDDIGYYDNMDHGNRRRNRSESPSQRDDTSRDAAKWRHVQSSTLHRNDRSSDSHSRSKDNSHVRDTYNTFSDQDRNGHIAALHEKRSESAGLVDGRHSCRRSVDKGNDPGDDRRLNRFHDHNNEELVLRRERKHDEAHDRHSDKRGERNSNCDNEKQQRKYGKSEQNDDRSATAEAGTLPISEVTASGDNIKDTKKRDRRYSTPSPRKSRKSKHRKSSSHHKSDNNSESDSSRSSNDTSPSNRRSRHHGSSSSRKHRRRDYDGADSEDNAVSSTSPRKRSSRKRRKKGRRNRSTKESETDDKGVPESDKNGHHRSKDKVQVSSIPEKDM